MSKVTGLDAHCVVELTYCEYCRGRGGCNCAYEMQLLPLLEFLYPRGRDTETIKFMHRQLKRSVDELFRQPSTSYETSCEHCGCRIVKSPTHKRLCTGCLAHYVKMAEKYGELLAKAHTDAVKRLGQAITL